MADKEQVQLGDVQHTLLITLSARAAETAKRRPVLRDPMAVSIVDSIGFDTDKYGSGWGDSVAVIRTSIFDHWVRSFLVDHPQGTVVELGCGLNTRFERVDNGSVHWVDVDLPDVIELRRRFFADTDRRTAVAASVLDGSWLDVVVERPGPYFFAAEGVLVYLPEDEMVAAMGSLARRFPGAFAAFDSYAPTMLRQQHSQADRKQMPAKWAWATNDPAALVGRMGMRVVESASVGKPPKAVFDALPARYRLLLPVVNPIVQGFGALTLCRA
ncbi:MAG TPA: class I SAM-dependent methyltransferase [Pseudonocardiaceae bacterium]|nr:class I SAM-dependent methyltransferase [Pseudonocardiaceae bacterium]